MANTKKFKLTNKNGVKQSKSMRGSIKDKFYIVESSKSNHLPNNSLIYLNDKVGYNIQNLTTGKHFDYSQITSQMLDTILREVNILEIIYEEA